MAFSDERSNHAPYQVLDPSGDYVGDRPMALDDDLRAVYYDLRLARRLDERGVNLQRQGTFGIYGEVAGQGAALVSSAYALKEHDWLVPSYREFPAMWVRGLSLRYLFAWFMGHSRGNRLPDRLNLLPLYIPVATQLPHAVGIAHGVRHTSEDEVVLVHFGDGATSEADFHEAMNVAGVFGLPTIFFCNNQWAISTPRDRQTASETFAQKARAYGFEGVRVDGMDPIVVFEVTRWARDRAIDNGGDPAPTFIESVEYRYGAHSTADDPSTYRDEAAVDAWRDRDPLVRTEALLRSRGVLGDDQLAAMDDRIETQLSAQLEAARGLVDAPEELFEHVLETPTAGLAEQRSTMDRFRDQIGDEPFRIH